MDFDGVFGHGGRGTHVGRKDLKVELHLLRRCGSILVGVGADDGHCVAVLEDLLVAQDGTVPSVTLVRGEGDEACDPVFPLNVLVGDDLVDAGHCLRLGGVDALYVGVGNLRLHEGGMESFLRHLEDEIGAEIQGSGDFCHGGGTGILAAPDPPVPGKDEFQILLVHFAPEHLGGIHDGIDNGNVPRTAAGVLVNVEPVPDFFPGRVGVGVEKGFRRHDEPRGAEAALGGPVLDPGLLDRMETFGGTDALDGGDAGSFRQPRHLVHAGPGILAVDDDAAGTAMALAASYLGPRQPELLPEHGGKGAVILHDDVPFDAVDKKDFLNHPFPSSFRSSAGAGRQNSGPERGQAMGTGTAAPFLFNKDFARDLRQ